MKSANQKRPVRPKFHYLRTNPKLRYGKSIYLTSLSDMHCLNSLGPSAPQQEFLRRRALPSSACFSSLSIETANHRRPAQLPITFAVSFRKRRKDKNAYRCFQSLYNGIFLPTFNAFANALSNVLSLISHLRYLDERSAYHFWQILDGFECSILQW